MHLHPHIIHYILFCLFSEAFAKAPSVKRVKQECPALAEQVLLNMERSPLCHSIALKIAAAARRMRENLANECVKVFFEKICDLFMSCFSDGTDYFLPSKLIEAYLKNVARTITNQKHREDLLDLISVVGDIPNQRIADLVLASVMRPFANTLLAFIIRSVVKGEGSQACPLSAQYAVSNDKTDSVEFKNILHYIAGSNVKSVLRPLMKSRLGEEQERLVSTIRQNILVADLADAPDAELVAWTETQDRGGLSKVTGKVLDFFVELGKIATVTERKDGSLLNEEFIEKVCCSRVVVLMWDDIIKNSLPSIQSFDLLHKLILKFTYTWRTGIVGRRMDEWSANRPQQKHGMGGVAFRPQVN